MTDKVTTLEEQRRRAEAFLALHHGPDVLVLPNAWDVVSARLYEVEGFAAVATTSAGVSATLGYPDGERMSLEEMIAVARRIASRLEIPLSVDMEAGYAVEPEGVARSTEAVIATEAVGVNIEDGTGDSENPLFDPVLQCERLTAAREAAAATGIPLVVNARVDVYLVSDAGPAERLRETVLRGNAYRSAGADCVFVPDMGRDLDRATIARLVDEIEAPLNIIAGPITPPVAELSGLGVARLTFGPRAMRVALALLRTMAREWLETGTYSAMLGESLSYSEVNRMLE